MSRTNLFFAAVILLVAAMNTPAAFQDKKAGKQNPPVNTARNNDSAGNEIGAAVIPATTDPSYVIGPEDVLDVNVWKEPDMTRVVPVRPDGKITLPLINDVQAAGSTPQQLASAVTERLHKFLTEPQVTVIVTQINSQRVFVVGEVLRAGAFPLVPGTTVLQAPDGSSAMLPSELFGGPLSMNARAKIVVYITLDPPRTTVVPLPVTSHAKPTRGEKFLRLGFQRVGRPGWPC